MTSGARGSPLRKPSERRRIRNQNPGQKQQQAESCDANSSPIDSASTPSFSIYIWMAYYLKPCLSKEVRLVNKTTFQTTLAPVWTSLFRENKKINPSINDNEATKQVEAEQHHLKLMPLWFDMVWKEFQISEWSFQCCRWEERKHFVVPSLLLESTRSPAN